MGFPHLSGTVCIWVKWVGIGASFVNFVGPALKPPKTYINHQTHRKVPTTVHTNFLTDSDGFWWIQFCCSIFREFFRIMTQFNVTQSVTSIQKRPWRLFTCGLPAFQIMLRSPWTHVKNCKQIRFAMSVILPLLSLINPYCRINMYVYIYIYIHIYGGSWNGGTPKASIYRLIFHYKPSILEYPHLWKPPYIYIFHVYWLCHIPVFQPKISMFKRVPRIQYPPPKKKHPKTQHFLELYNVRPPR